MKRQLSRISSPPSIQLVRESSFSSAANFAPHLLLLLRNLIYVNFFLQNLNDVQSGRIFRWTKKELFASAAKKRALIDGESKRSYEFSS